MTSPIERQAAFRNTIEHFLKERLDAKLDKLQADDPKRAELIAQHARETWLADAARRVTQIQIVTHTLKPIHPDARGSNLFRAPHELPAHMEVGSHVLGHGFSSDVVGNAASLDVFKLLKLQVDGRPLLAWMQESDPDLLAALSDNADQAIEWLDAFTGITTPRSAIPSSHTLAKQLYWLAGEDPADDGQYHLLAPLYASALATRFSRRSTKTASARQENSPARRVANSATMTPVTANIRTSLCRSLAAPNRRT